MKNGIPRRIGLAIVVTTLMPMTAVHAFVDERTPPAPPAPPLAQIAPEIVAPKLVVPLNQAAVQQAPAQQSAVPQAPVQNLTIPGVNAAPAQAIAAGVTGDFTGPAWTSAYPGPFGTMPLADALIAQVVPVVGTAIELNGPAELLSQQVVVPTGASRAATLRAVADAHGLNIAVAGTKVTLAKAGVAPASMAVASGPTPEPYVAPVTPKPAEPIPVPEPVKGWHLAKGAMLSTAMMEWAQLWGWELIWQADVDYRIAADITMNETFLNGVGKVLEAYRSGARPLWGDWNDEQKVLVIREPNNIKK